MNVYDFDNTLYDGESCFDFFVYYLKKSPRLILYLPRLFIAFFKYKRGLVTVEQALQKYAPQVEAFFRSIDDVNGDCVDFWDRHMRKIKPFYKSLQRDDDLIITASPDFSMAEICGRLGIKSFIASEVDLETGKIVRLNLRSAKIVSFREKYPDAEIDCFYTDSPKNDKPLIDLARHTFLVRGSKITQIK